MEERQLGQMAGKNDDNRGTDKRKRERQDCTYPQVVIEKLDIGWNNQDNHRQVGAFELDQNKLRQTKY